MILILILILKCRPRRHCLLERMQMATAKRRQQDWKMWPLKSSTWYFWGASWLISLGKHPMSAYTPYIQWQMAGAWPRARFSTRDLETYRVVSNYRWQAVKLMHFLGDVQRCRNTLKWHGFLRFWMDVQGYIHACLLWKFPSMFPGKKNFSSPCSSTLPPLYTDIAATRGAQNCAHSANVLPENQCKKKARQVMWLSILVLDGTGKGKQW